ncbi:lamin tail domain-containing protein [Streptomyces sp. NPDC050617]|uniref:lamin tail domain-containing protein n=1 Tax=Streptomyces sp. NPDC050617 TaxID=3154628 RepID=UPI00342CA600
MRHRIAATILATGTAAATLFAAAPASAAPSVHITEIYYNSPGKDTRSNSSLNAEWVRIKNPTSRAVNLRNWKLTDASRHQYTFGSYTLGAGKSVKVRTGRGGDTAANRYQDRRAYVWNNDRDTATLRKSNGSKADSCSYNNSRRASVLC